MRKVLVAFLALLALPAWAATLLPNGKQQFFSVNGYPLSSGSVYFYVPGTTTPKSTWQDSGQTILNTNPVKLDAGGFALIYGSGAYREVVKDALGNLIYDQLTADTSAAGSSSWAGTAGGTANAIAVTATNFSAADGQTVSWRVAATNTGPATVTIGANTYNLVKDTVNGVTALSGGEMVQGGIVTAIYDSTTLKMHLVTPTDVGPQVTVAGATTTDLGAAGSQNVNVTGTASISSFGTTAQTASPFYNVTFAGASTIVYSASLTTPSGGNIVTIAGASATLQYLGGGAWKVLEYSLPSGASGEFINAQIGTTYTMQASDWGKLVSFSNTAAVAFSIPAGVAEGGWVDVQNVNTGPVTITPAAGTINGAASQLLPSGYGLRLVADGANWQIKGTTPLNGRVLLSALLPVAGSIADTVSFTSLFTNYDVEYYNIVGSAATANLTAQVQSGGVFQTTTYQSLLSRFYFSGGIFVTDGANSTTGVLLSTGTLNSGLGATGKFTILGAPGVSGRKVILGENSDSQANIAHQLTNGYWDGGNGAITGVKLFMSSGTIASGAVKIYGYN